MAKTETEIKIYQKQASLESDIKQSREAGTGQAVRNTNRKKCRKIKFTELRSKKNKKKDIYKEIRT